MEHCASLFLVLFASIIQGSACLRFTHPDEESLVLSFLTPPQTLITRLFAYPRPDTYTVSRLGQYFRVDNQGRLYLNQKLSAVEFGVGTKLTVVVEAATQSARASTRLLIRLSDQPECDITSLCFTHQSQLRFSLPREEQGDVEVGFLGQPSWWQICDVTNVGYTLRQIRTPGGPPTTNLLQISNKTSTLSVHRSPRVNTITTMSADVTCHVTMTSSTTSHTRNARVTVDVTDVDDQGPYIKWRLKGRKFKERTRTLNFTERYCGKEHVVVDDDLGPDNYSVRVEGDSHHVFTLRSPHTLKQMGGKQFIFAVLDCERPLENLGVYEVKLIFTDESIVSAMKNKREAYYVIRVDTGTGPVIAKPQRPTQAKSDTIHESYKIATEKITVNTSAAKFYRVLDLGTKMSIPDDADWRFLLTDNVFNITSRRGYIYVQDQFRLSESETEVKILHVMVNDLASKRHGFVRIPVKIVHVNHTTGPVHQCAQYWSLEECEHVHGLGTRDGKCQARKHGTNRINYRFRTCSYDLRTCPDGVCDELEQVGDICPQDCIKAAKVLGAQPSSRERGIYNAQHCNCNYQAKLGEWRDCVCSMLPANRTYSEPTGTAPGVVVLMNHSMFTPHPAVGSQHVYHTAMCGETCRTVLTMLGTIAGLALLVGLVVYSTGAYKLCARRARKAGDLKHMNDLVALHRDREQEDGWTRLEENWAQNYVQQNVLLDDKWEISRSRLTLDENGKIGEGEFGQVVRAKLGGGAGLRGSLTRAPGSQGLHRQQATPVAVKMLKDCAGETELRDLVSEFCLLKEVTHPNVVKLLGACTQDGPFYIIVEYCEMGSLRDYLRSRRQLTYLQPNYDGNDYDVTHPVDQSASEPRVTVKELLSYAWQVAKGMEYLSSMKLVHRDLACRNVLVTATLEAKISDFGLTRDIYEADNYKKMSKGRIPFRWMAPESLYDQIYTTKSDVWSFGILLWEIATLGATPYPGITPERLCSMLKSGYRMERPENCSLELYSIMTKCWMTSNFDRPSFTELVHKLDELLISGANYLDLNHCNYTPIVDDEPLPQEVTADVPARDVRIDVSDDVRSDVSTSDEGGEKGRDSGMGSSGSQSDERGEKESPTSYENKEYGSLDAVSMDSCFLPNDQSANHQSERTKLLMTSQCQHDDVIKDENDSLIGCSPVVVELVV